MNDAGPQEIARPLLLRFPAREQVVFAKRLGMILRSGLPLREGLAIVGGEHTSRSAAYIFARILSDVSRGRTLSSSLASLSPVFGSFAVHIVRVGETSGMLHQNLEHLSRELKKKEALKKKVLGALVYPAVIVLATIGISLGLTIYIFPKIIPIFQSFKQSLPLSTRVLIAVSGFLVRDGVFVLAAVVAAAAGFFFLLRFEPARRALERVLLRLPIFGALSRSYQLANITRTIGVLLQGDMRIVEALEIVAQTSHSGMYRDALRHIAAQAAQGQRLSRGMRANPRLFPPLCAQMVSAGEETGSLAASLLYLSDMYEEDINDLTRNLTTLLEPMLMIVMGLIVGFIAISIITPIYGITQNLTPH